MSISKLIKKLCVELDISVSELARRTNTSPQAFSQKMKRESFTPSELSAIAEAVRCTFECSFILPDGKKISD